MPSEVKIPKFTYPFKRNTTNSATKEKSTQEFYEEILFKDSHGQYLFNRSGLFHGGVHLYEDRFPINDFYIDGIRAIADGKLIYYRIDKDYLENELDNGSKLKYSSSFMLLEHEMRYPADNTLKFYSLYMHMAPVDDYTFIEHTLEGNPVYVRDMNGADMLIAQGTKISLGDSLKGKTVGAGLIDKENRYELLSYGNDNRKPPVGQLWNVHITNLKKVVETTVTGTVRNIPNMRKGASSTSPIIKVLTVGDTIKVNAFQSVKEKKNKYYRVLSINGVAPSSSKARVHKSNLTDSITEPIIGNLKENGLVTKHMASLAGRAVLSASEDLKVKAGEVLGKLGCYNLKEWEDELESMVHVEVFSFKSISEIQAFITAAKTEYDKPTTDMTPTVKAAYDKVRPKENLLFVKKEVTRYAKESYTYAKLKEADWLRDKTVRTTATDKTLNVLKVNGAKQKIKKDAIIKINPTKSGNRYNVISVEEGDDEVQSVISTDTVEKWSVWHESIEMLYKFSELPTSAKEFYRTVYEPLKTLKKLKDKEGTVYLPIDTIANIEVYIKDDEAYKTHGITFPNFTLIDEADEKMIGIFKDVSKYYSIEEETVPQQEKELLNETFKKILQKIKVDTNNNGNLEAGEFAGLSLTKEKRKALSYMMVKHESEWEVAREETFEPILNYMEHHQLTDHKKMFEDRLDKLAFSPKLLVGEGKIPTFIHPIALVEGFVGGEKGCITVDMLSALDENLVVSTEILNALNKYCKKYEVDTPIKIAHFLAHLAVESGNFATRTEDTRFRKSTAKGFDKYIAYARIHGENNPICPGVTDRSFCLQPALHNLIYSGSNENHADPSVGDGYRFRGRGFIQLTHRKKYRRYTAEHNRLNPDDIQDFIANPDLVASNINYAVESAFMYWRNWGALSRRFNARGDINILIDNAPYDITLSSQGVNGGRYGHAHGLSERITKFTNMIEYFNLPTGGII